GSPPRKHRLTRDRPDAVDDDPLRHALGVRAGGVEHPAGVHQRYPASIAARVALRTVASCSVTRGIRGARVGPPYRPTMSIESLMAWTNSVLLSQRSNG